MEEWGEKRDELIDLFGKVRDEWIEEDLATWIGANRYIQAFKWYRMYFPLSEQHKE